MDFIKFCKKEGEEEEKNYFFLLLLLLFVVKTMGLYFFWIYRWKEKEDWGFCFFSMLFIFLTSFKIFSEFYPVAKSVAKYIINI